MTGPSRRPSMWQLGFAVNAAFQASRGMWVDAAIFALAVVLMQVVSGATRRPVRGLPAPSPGVRVAVTFAMVVSVASVQVHSGATRAVVLALAPVTLWQALALPSAGVAPAGEGRGEPLPQALWRSRLIWSWWFIALSCWEAIAYTLSRAAHNDAANPTVTVLLTPSLESGVGRACFALLWLGFGMRWMFEPV